MPTLKQAQQDPKAMKEFIEEHEGLEADGEAVQRYIDASATPLDSRKEGQSKFYQGSDDDCK